jgi:putative FmdB family regulatory protein
LQQEVEMPLFEYKCRDCGTAFEKIVATATTPVVCKQCESPRVEKLLSVFAVGGASRSAASLESGPCGACGAAQRGMCGVE